MLIQKFAELHGRAIESSSRVRQAADSLEAMQRELSLVRAAMEKLLNSPGPPQIALPVASSRMLRRGVETDRSRALVSVGSGEGGSIPGTASVVRSGRRMVGARGR
jgi:hypothetical protein